MTHALQYFNAEIVQEVASLGAENERLRAALQESLAATARANAEVARVNAEVARATAQARQAAEDAALARADREHYAQRYELLVQQLFGKRSERRILDASEFETLPLFTLGELPVAPAPHTPAKVEEVSKKSPVGTTDPKPKMPRDRGAKFPASLRREVVEVPVEEPCCACCGGADLHLIRTVVTEKLCCSRDPMYVKQYRRPVYGCRACDTAQSAPAVPEEVFERTAVEESVVAQLAVNKFRYSLPLFRQVKQFQDVGLRFTEDALIDWVLKGTALVMPVYEELCRSVEGSAYLLADDTPFQAAGTKAEDDKTVQYRRGCLWSLLGDKQEVVYKFAASRTHSSCREALGTFRGSLIVDGYDGFERFSVLEGVALTHCNAHARRYFVRAEGSDGKRAHEALAFYRALYDIEARCKERGLSPPEVVVVRQAEAVPILTSFKEWLAKVSLAAPPKTPLGKACSYVLNRWESLTRYTTDGRLPIDTNELERLIRVVAIGKKNYLHAASELGAQAAAVMYSLVNSCLMIEVDPFLYLSDVMWRVSEKVKVSELIPRNWKPLFLEEAKRKYGSMPPSSASPA